ncbi:MAG: hypothetical protein J0I20_32950 [Chloroflexi bacterium]|nr:hypothetical protein [Chloroflexota bacterium]OJV87029.1 MAG: hypothetical protein BGO39_33225 [Chloroflexi bacterium 54-19]
MSNLLNKSDYAKADVTVEAGKAIPVNFLQEVKARLDLLTVACELYPDLKTRGSTVYQGGHVGVHDSKNGQCLTVWPGTNSWKCFNCGQGGDVIDLIGVSIFGSGYSRHGTEFVAALNEAARRAGLSQEHLTPEQKVELAERERIYSLLTDAARWYNAQFEKYPEIYEYLQTNYGFREEFIQEKAIGFAPPCNSFDPDKGFLETSPYPIEEPLIDHLLNLSYTTKEIMASSLASKGGYTIYQGRLMFPYWQNGKVVYFTARATSHTPYTVYETHPSGELKKYLKLKVRDEKNKQISELIRNDWLFGIDTLKVARQKGYLLITEGVPDQLAAEQAGEPCISPLTTTFSKAQQQQLLKAVKSIRGLKVFICNDNEKNQAGEKGAIATALFLEKQGVKTYLIKLPRPAGRDKVDLCEFLRDNGATPAVLSELYSTALRLPDYCLQHQPLPLQDESNDVKAAFINEVAELTVNVCHYDPLNLAALQEKLAGALKVNKSLIKTMFRQVPGQSRAGAGSGAVPVNERGQGQSEMAGSENEPEQGETERKSQATMLVELSGDLELFHNGEGKAFASFLREEPSTHTETWPLRSRSFKLILKERFFRQYGQVPRTPALEDALSLLEARALFGPQRQIYNRIARFGESIYLDLSNENWEVVKIGPTGWEILQNSPIRFRRSSGMLPMVTPLHGGRLDRLRQFVNVTDQDWKLLAAWLVTAFNPECQYPVLTMSGEQGSAKSTASRFIRRLIDPSLTLLRAAPRDERDFWIGAQNSWMVAYDNLSGIPAWLSDTLCRVSTGGGNVTRLLYSDDEEVFFDARRPVLLNGIDAVATRGDLLERSLVLNLPAIDEKDRKSERQLTLEFEAALPDILGGLLDAVSLALSRIESVRLNRLPRMADFTLWSVAAEPAFGGPSGTISFLEAYTRQREDSHVLALEASPLAQTFLGWYTSFTENYPLEKGCWLGNANTLLRELEQSLPEIEQKLVVRQLTWPKNARSLSVQLHRLAPNLRAMGLDLTFDVYQGEIKRGIQIQPVYPAGKTASETSGYKSTQNHPPGTQTFGKVTQIKNAGTQTGSIASTKEVATEFCVPHQWNEFEAKSTGIDLTGTEKTQGTQILTKESREFVGKKETEAIDFQNRRTSEICVPFVPATHFQPATAVPTPLLSSPFAEKTSFLPFGPAGGFDMELTLESDLEEEEGKAGDNKELETGNVLPLNPVQEERQKQSNFSLERLAGAIEEACGDYQALLNLKQQIDLASNLSFQEKYQLGYRLKVLINALLFPFSSKE